MGMPHINKVIMMVCMASAVPAVGAQLPVLRITDNPEVKIMPNSTSELKVSNDRIEVTTNGWASGIIFENDWNLTGYNRVRFNVENLDSVQYLQMTFHMQDKKKYVSPIKGAAPGTLTDNFYVAPRETRQVEIWFPAEILYPDVDAAFGGMHVSPYAYAGHYAYRFNPSNVKAIKVLARRHTAGVHYVISDLIILPGKVKEPEPMMKLGKNEFFPFIDSFGQFKHKEWPGKIHCDNDLKKALKAEEKDLANHPGPKDRSRFGGWLNGPRLQATGHYRVEKVNGKWWLVDPEGYLFWSHGVVRVTPSSGITPLDNRRHYFESLPKENSELGQFYFTYDTLMKPYYEVRNIDTTYDYSCANIYRKYGSDFRKKFAEMSHRRLKSWGLNTIANSSDRSIYMMDQTPYVERIEIHSKPLEGAGGAWWHFMDPFDPSFEATERERLEAKRKEIEDPWCIGLFVDNEINWGTPETLATAAITAPATQAAKIEMINDLKKKYISIENLNEKWGSRFDSWDALLANRDTVPAAAREDIETFNRRLIEEYFSTVRRVFKEYAPNKLYLGCRFAGWNIDVLSAASRYCDVISYNLYYHNLNWFKIPGGFDKPVMIGEFHFGATDCGLFHPGQVHTNNQKDRARSYYDYVHSALIHPNIIGTHWHQFSDQMSSGRFDGENFQVGLTDVCDTPYYDTIEKIRDIGYGMYETRYNDKLFK